MGNKELVMPCPLCNSRIPIDTMQMVMGVQFPCPNPACEGIIGVGLESGSASEKTMKKLEELKKNSK